MKLVALNLALLLAACAGAQRPDGEAGPRKKRVIATVEVRLPADPYTPSARALPLLHELGGRVCGRHYRIADRHMDYTLDSQPVYLPAAGVVRPGFYHAYAIIATIECLSSI